MTEFIEQSQCEHHDYNYSNNGTEKVATCRYCGYSRYYGLEFNTNSYEPPKTFKLSIVDQEAKPKVDISVVDCEVVVTLAEGIIASEGATAFFDALTMVLPTWIETAGYIRK